MCSSDLSDLDRLNEKIYNKIYEAAKDLVKTGEEISREFGIPIVNKRISVTPIGLAHSHSSFRGYRHDRQVEFPFKIRE